MGVLGDIVCGVASVDGSLMQMSLKELLMMEGCHGVGRNCTQTENSFAFHWWQFLTWMPRVPWLEPCPTVVPFVRQHNVTFKHDNARPHVARLSSQFLAAENVQVLDWPAYSPNPSPIERVWDTLDLRVQGCTAVPGTVRQPRIALQQEWTSILQATIDILLIHKRCVTLRDAHSGHKHY
jgi:hypothetical protein